MGFDVVYLPPIHPIGTTARKGPGNTLVAGPGDPGSPWAIGAAAGGHPAIDPARHHRRLRRLRRRRGGQRPGGGPRLRAAVLARPSLGRRAPRVVPPPARRHHPLRREPAEEVPGHLPDQLLAGRRTPTGWRCGTPARRSSSTGSPTACAIFRVDNPHTKPFAFWEWLIADGAPASTPTWCSSPRRSPGPKVMAKLAEIGFSQSYTYFTWRHRQTAGARASTSTELAHGPDGRLHAAQLLAQHARHPRRARCGDGPPAAFALRARAGRHPGADLGHLPRLRAVRERAGVARRTRSTSHSEKYEIKDRDCGPARLARAVHRRASTRSAARHPALRRAAHDPLPPHRQRRSSSSTRRPQRRRRPTSCSCVVNLDPAPARRRRRSHSTSARSGCLATATFDVLDELTGERYTWSGPDPYVRLDPAVQVAHVLAIEPADA